MKNEYPFSLEFKHDEKGNPLFAEFMFIFDGSPVQGISCYLSSRFAGDMKFEGSHRLTPRFGLFESLELNPDRVFGVKQIHSRDVLVVDDDNPPVTDADGMVTCDKNIALSVTVADCLPVFLYDTKTKAFGIVHSGWKGTGIVIDAIKLMIEKWGTDPGDISAILGPCIGVCCYKVDQQRASIFEKDFGSESVKKENNEYYLDLKTANINLLSAANVQNISVCQDCTFTNDVLGSFRRQGEVFTRMAAVISLHS